MCVHHTEEAEQHRQEDEAVCHPQQRDDQIQPEEEDLNELSFSESQHDDSRQVGHSNASKHLSYNTRHMNHQTRPQKKSAESLKTPQLFQQFFFNTLDTENNVSKFLVYCRWLKHLLHCPS